MDYGALRNGIETCLREAIKDAEKRRIKISRRASGSASGLPFESWTKDVLSRCGYNVFLQEEFVGEVVKRLKEQQHAVSDIEKVIREKTWWGMKDYMVGKRQLEEALKGSEVSPYQQSVADIVLFYGKDLAKDLNDAILINVKSHDIDKESRDPNVISAKRILEFFIDILEKATTYPEFIDKVNLWFIGIYYKKGKEYSEIREVHVKDFFKLDVTQIPEINFDAAIQIQWHIKNMVEINNIDKLTFVENLAKEYAKRWKEFSKRRTQNIEETVKRLEDLITKIRNQKRLS